MSRSFESNSLESPHKDKVCGIQQDEPPTLEGLERTGVFCGSICKEIAGRSKYYWSDWVDGFHSKTVSAALFMFFATFASTIALGELARRKTDSHIGVTEYLMMQGASGFVHAILGAQPLLILRPTGPITVFMVELYTLSNQLGVDFYTWLALVGIWVGVMMAVTSFFDGCSYIKHFTRFLHELYSTFVCTIYIADGIGGVIDRFHQAKADGEETFGASMYGLLLCSLTVGIGLWLHTMKSRKIFPDFMKKLIVDYALTIAIAIAIGISYASTRADVDRIPLPHRFGPTLETEASEPGRTWLVSSLDSDNKKWLPAAAALAAIPIVALFYIDQNISTVLTQVPTMRLQKGSYYNWGYFLVSIMNAVCPLFGLPFITASLPHSPQFARALADTAGPQNDIVRVHENRIAPACLYAACGFALFIPSVLEVIPEGVVDGILVFVGIVGIIKGNEFVERIFLILTPSKNFPKDRKYTSVEPKRMHGYTIIQIVCLCGCWIIKSTPAGLAFPLFIVALLPLRRYILPKIFTSKELAALDSAEIVEDTVSLVSEEMF